jgi:hypothetical protein
MFRKFLNSNEGNLALVFAIATVPVMAAVASGVDFVSVNNKAEKVQSALDTAALAVATRYYSGMSDEELEAIGQEFFDSNVNAHYTNPNEFDYVEDFEAEAQTIGQEDHIAVRSSVTHEGMIGSITWKATRQSVVRIAPGEPACVLALDKTASSAIKLQGSTQIEMKGCRLAANSKASDAISRGGSAKILAECVSSVGGTSGLESNSNAQLDCPKPLERQYPAQDPLAGLKLPAYTSCKNAPGGQTKTLTAGTYCNETLSGEVTLEPGTYIFRGGKVKLGGNGSLAGKGVTIFLMEDAEFSINANQTVQLSPPESGDYAGITIYQERTNTSPLTINGTAGSQITGFIYAPGAHIFHAGNSAMSSSGNCVRMVGNTIEMTGNSSVSIDCEKELGGRKMFAGRYMVIVR